MELLHHLWQLWQYQHVNTGMRAIQGRVIRASSDYILGTDWRRFEMVGIRGIRNYPSDHLILRARLIVCPTNAGHKCDAGVLPTQMGTMNGVIE